MTEDLRKLIDTLSAWSAQHQAATIYLFGSRLRGDHRADSDVDIIVEWDEEVPETDIDLWGEQNATDFTELKEHLPGRLSILENNDPVAAKVMAASDCVVCRRSNVICVDLPPKTARKKRYR